MISETAFVFVLIAIGIDTLAMVLAALSIYILAGAVLNLHRRVEYLELIEATKQDQQSSGSQT